MEDQVEAVQTDEMLAQAERDFAQYEMWSKFFSEREQAEISFCNMYHDGFNHGTDGHLLRIIVAKMADLLTQSSPAREYRVAKPFEI